MESRVSPATINLVNHMEIKMTHADYMPQTSRNLKLTGKRYIITSAQNDSNYDHLFLKALEQWASYNDAELIIKPFTYRNPTTYKELDTPTWSPCFMPYLLTDCVDLGEVEIRGDINVQGATSNPLVLVGAISKKSAVIPHPVIGVKAIASPSDEYPHYYLSTGAVTYPNASATLAGSRSEFHHTLGALILEINPTNPQQWLFRHVRADKHSGFHDLDLYYRPFGVVSASVAGLVLGDVHLGVHSQRSLDASVGIRESSMIRKLKPYHLVLHDVLDWSSDSHHGQNLTSRVHKTPFADVYEELIYADAWVRDLCRFNPDTTVNMVYSNHHYHFDRWLDRFNHRRQSRSDIVVAARTLEAMAETGKPAWESWFSTSGHRPPNLVWLDPKRGYYINGVDVSQHGDRGINGARGSLLSYAKAKSKTITGHSHEAGVVQGATSVGCLCTLPESYASGLSTHDHANAVIYPDGSVTLLPIRDGVWSGW